MSHPGPPLLKTLPLGLCQSRLSHLQIVVYFYKGELYKALAVRATSPLLSPVQATMIHERAPYRVLTISELARHIASQLVLIEAEGSAVNLACACRSLEEPILSTLWETQSSLYALLGVLPENLEYLPEVVRDPAPGDWDRVKRYASWMRQVHLYEWMHPGKETFKKLRLNSPPGGWFPTLQDLSFCIKDETIPYADLFFSPHLKRVSIVVTTAWKYTGIPPRVLPLLVPTLSALPTSALEQISVQTRHRTVPWAHLKDLFSSIVLRCGPSFTEYDSPIPLSDAALDHLIQLPHLHTWCIYGPPPTYPASSLPLVFPPLRELTLGGGATRGWLPLLGRLEGGTAAAQGVTPLFKAKESLKVLNVEETLGIDIDPSSVSTIQCFRNLVHLNWWSFCYRNDHDGDECIFKLNNDNITELTMALTQLESLLLGYPCSENTCFTTVACLLPISVHCNKLEKLRIHFNTTNIVDDFKNILEDPRFQQLRSLPRCPLVRLDAGRIPLNLDKSGSETVVKGMIDIFPSLTLLEGRERSWDKLSKEITHFWGDSE